MRFVLGLTLLLSFWLVWTGIRLWRKAVSGRICPDHLTPRRVRRMAVYHFLAALAVPGCVGVYMIGGDELWAVAGPPAILLTLAGVGMRARRALEADMTDGVPSR